MLQAFDAPNGDASCVRRSRSNTPLQALTTLNEPLFMEAARSLALHTLKEGGPGDTERLNYAFRRVLARTPTADESKELLALLERSEARVKPWELLDVRPEWSPVLPAPARQVAAWTIVTRVLLNLDETITKE
jgi:hypothetical protein